MLVSWSSVWFCQSLSSSRPSEHRRRLIPNSREQKRDRAPCPAVPAEGTPRSPSQFAQVAPKPEGIPQKQGTLRKLSSARIGSGRGLRGEQGLARLCNLWGGAQVQHRGQSPTGGHWGLLWELPGFLRGDLIQETPGIPQGASSALQTNLNSTPSLDIRPHFPPTSKTH